MLLFFSRICRTAWDVWRTWMCSTLMKMILYIYPHRLASTYNIETHHSSLPPHHYMLFAFNIGISISWDSFNLCGLLELLYLILMIWYCNERFNSIHFILLKDINSPVYTMYSCYCLLQWLVENVVILFDFWCLLVLYHLYIPIQMHLWVYWLLQLSDVQTRLGANPCASVCECVRVNWSCVVWIKGVFQDKHFNV